MALHPRCSGIQKEEIQRSLRQITSAVSCCHKKGIMHLDLKVDNMHVDSRGNIKLIHFSLSTRVTSSQKLNRFWGTRLYFAPEVILWKEY